MTSLPGIGDDWLAWECWSLIQLGLRAGSGYDLDVAVCLALNCCGFKGSTTENSQIDTWSPDMMTQLLSAKEHNLWLTEC